MESAFAQQALEAWWSAQPDGVFLPVSKLSSAIATLEVPLPRKEVLAIFESFCDDAQAISFLVFWKAWAHLGRLQDQQRTDDQEDHLFLELQTFRDTLLRYIAVARRDFPISYLIQETDRARKMSDFPAFWDMCRSTMHGLARSNPAASSSSTPARERARQDETDEKSLSIEDATVILISWLLEAIAFQRERGAKEQSREQDQGLPVYIHIYDVSQESVIRKLNRFTANKFSPLKFGGVFHAGVEVAQLEWSYGATMVNTMSGIVCHEIKTHPQHRYRQTVFMGFTSLTAEEVAELISEMVELYPGWDYDLLRRNCCHFADDMCQRMGVGRIPGWIYRFARVGAGVDAMIMAIKNLRGGNKSEEEEIPNAISN